MQPRRRQNGEAGSYLEANWNKVKAVMFASGKLDRLTKEIMAVAVSAVQGCRY